MLRSRHGLQSALSYPFSVIPPSISLSLKMAVHSVMIPPTLSLSLFLSACHPTGFSCSDYCLFIQKQNPLWRGCTILTENEETDLSFLFLFISLSHTDTHTCPNAASNGYQNKPKNHHKRKTQISSLV